MSLNHRIIFGTALRLSSPELPRNVNSPTEWLIAATLVPVKLVQRGKLSVRNDEV